MLAGDDVVPELTPAFSVGEWLGHPVVGPACARLFLEAMPAEPAAKLQLIGSMPMGRLVADLGAAVPVEELERLVLEVRTARLSRAGGRGR